MARGVRASDEEISLYSRWLSQLVQFDRRREASAVTLDRLKRIQEKVKQNSHTNGDARAKAQNSKLFQIREELCRKSREELRSLDSALESLDILIALRHAPLSASTSSNNLSISLNSKKRKAPEEPSSPTSSVSTSLSDVSGSGMSKTITGSSANGSAAGLESQPKKAKRDTTGPGGRPSLPLKPGRRVAFRQPRRSSGVSGTSNGSVNGAQTHGNVTAQQSSTDAVLSKDSTWILASVVKCIGGDRNRYIVEDDDPDENEAPTGERPTYNTTLKALIPLPTATEPGPSIRTGQAVYALYPDTSCFYRAKVIAGPLQSPDGRRFKVQFEDDNEEVRTVKWDMIVEVPGREL